MPAPGESPRTCTRAICSAVSCCGVSSLAIDACCTGGSGGAARGAVEQLKQQQQWHSSGGGSACKPAALLCSSHRNGALLGWPPWEGRPQLAAHRREMAGAVQRAQQQGAGVGEQQAVHLPGWRVREKEASRTVGCMLTDPG